MKEVVGLENLLEAIFTTAGAGTISAIVRDEVPLSVRRGRIPHRSAAPPSFLIFYSHWSASSVQTNPNLIGSG